LLPQEIGDVIGSEGTGGMCLLQGCGHRLRAILPGQLEKFGNLAGERAVRVRQTAKVGFDSVLTAVADQQGDQLRGVSAGGEMKRTFVPILRSLAHLAKEPRSTDVRSAVERSYSLRETINDIFDKVRALADGVVFEFGPSRQHDLGLRDRIRRWQPRLRLLFLTRITLLKFRFQLPGSNYQKP
jgi:hypothetical protein